MFQDLFALRFPNLRAFQLRNAVVIDTLLPPGLYLLDHTSIGPRNDVRVHANFQFDGLPGLDLAGLEFMEAHPNLQCLGWPMDAFFSGKPINPDIAHRVQTVVDNLGRSLLTSESTHSTAELGSL